MARFDVEQVRSDFPILNETINGKPLVYLDNAATSQKPQSVLNAIDEYFAHYNSNVHRGLHHLSEKATAAYEQARVKTQRFINASDAREIVFTRGTTESVNLVAQAYGRTFLKEGDEVTISTMEHHSNIVPWQLLREQTGIVLRIIPITDEGEIDIKAYRSLLTNQTRIVSFTHVSNSLGTINPVREMTRIAHEVGALVLIDGAQAAPHLKIDVREIDCDFYAISGHKMFGPTGIGALFGKRELLETMPPYQGGGEMIKSVTFDKTTFNDLPHKFEAGTPNIAGAIGLGATIDYLNQFDWNAVQSYEDEVLAYAHQRLREVEGLRFIGTAHEKTAVVSFILEDIHPHDIGTILDHEGLAIRSGHHCAQPVMDRFGVPATARASFALYNTKEEVDELVRALAKVREVFG